MREIIIDIATQTLVLLENNKELHRYPISSGANGVGEEMNSEKTPRGRHMIRTKIGEGADVGTIFSGRRSTGEIYQPSMIEKYPNRDWILTRILWLSGLEVEKNRLGNVDTMRRYIYIHGSPDEVPMGTPGSRGCVRMHNHDVIELFDRVSEGCLVFIRGQ